MQSQELPTAVAANELLARYIFYSKHFSSKGPKRQAFEPYKGSVSVTRYNNDNLREAVCIGHQVGQKRDKPLKAVASISARCVRSVELEVVADTEHNQHPWHANIKNFSLEKAQSKRQASKLAQLARIVHTSVAVR